MSKKLLVTLFAVSALTVVASSAYAASALQTPAQLKLSGYNPSNNVLMGYESTTNTGAYYALDTKHTQGNKIFGTTSTSTSIYWKEGVAGTALAGTEAPDCPTNTDSAAPGGWNTQ